MECVAGLAWDALERVRHSRDERFDGKVFIAIRSTKIFCRPICPSPTSKPKNVRYYATATEAIDAGYRPCLRCRPEAAPGSPAWLGTCAVVRRALRLIRDGALDEESVAQLADRLGVGTRHLNRLFTRHVGISPGSIAQTRRLQFAKRLLDETALPITRIALAAGYGSLRRFNHCFQATYHRPPRELRRRRPGIAQSPAAEIVTLRLAYRPPFDWRQALQFLAARAIPGVECVDASGYHRAVNIDEAVASIRVTQLADEHCLALEIRGAEAATLFSLSTTAKRVFDVAADPVRTDAAFADDPWLGPLARRWPGTRILGVWDPFECLVRAMVGAWQVPSTGAATLARLANLAGTALPGAPPHLTHAFPTARQLLRADLARVGLGAARTDTLRRLARAIVAGSVDWRAATADVLARLAEVPGFDPAAGQYIALFGLGEPDAFPVSSDLLRRLRRSSGAPAAAESWRPWRGYAAMLAWRAASSRSDSGQRGAARMRNVARHVGTGERGDDEARVVRRRLVDGDDPGERSRRRSR
jgi:AraC family transcriptional regulator of adaptative response / DNA-3-methyladenine glycosylase II